MNLLYSSLDMQYKAILFDADGVVLLVHEMFSHQYAKRCGIDPTEMTPFFIGVFQECIIWKADLKELLMPRLPRRKRYESVDAFLDLWFSSESALHHSLLERIDGYRAKGVICCLATNQEQYRANYLLHHLHLADHFDHWYVSSHLWVKKPDPVYFQTILDDLSTRYGYTPEQICFLDDSPENIAQAEKLGIKSVVYTGDESIEKSNSIKYYL